MPRTPDRFPGEREEEGILLTPVPDSPGVNGEIRYIDGVGFQFFQEGIIRMFDDDASVDATHENIDSLVHELAEDSYLEITRDIAGLVASSVYWTNSNKVRKIRESIVTRGVDGRVTQVEENQYDGLGAVIQSITTTITREDGHVVSTTMDETLDSTSGVLIDHEVIDSLVHNIAEDAYLEINRDVNDRVASTIYWTDSSKILKIREVIVSRDVDDKVYQTEERQYDASGGLVHKVVMVITRTSGKISSADLDEV